MFTIKNDLNGELIVNKSRFITYVYKVNNVLEVNEKIDALKAKYKDATHYCYSYIIDNIKRFNDDKEPSHTAGMPIPNDITVSTFKDKYADFDESKYDYNNKTVKVEKCDAAGLKLKYSIEIDGVTYNDCGCESQTIGDSKKICK